MEEGFEDYGISKVRIGLRGNDHSYGGVYALGVGAASRTMMDIR